MKEVYINLKEQGDCFIWRYLQEKCKSDLVSIDDLIWVIEELIADNEKLQEEFEDLENNLRDNYKPLSRSDYTGDSYDDNF